MSLAFALMAAINGSTGSRATLTYGLYGTKPRRRQSGGSEDSHCSEAAAQAARVTDLKIARRFSFLRGGGGAPGTLLHKPSLSGRCGLPPPGGQIPSPRLRPNP
jgi:hypothetical protein